MYVCFLFVLLDARGFLFRCVLASLYEAVSVRMSACPYGHNYLTRNEENLDFRDDFSCLSSFIKKDK